MKDYRSELGVILYSVFPTAQQLNLPACPQHYPLMLNVKQASSIQIFDTLVQSDSESTPDSTSPEADAQHTSSCTRVVIPLAACPLSNVFDDA